MKINVHFSLRLLLVTVLVINSAVVTSYAMVKKSHQFGDVTMQQTSSESKNGPVVFRHWTHRDKFSCRLCHVDLEFAQVAGETEIYEEDNQAGRFCGACHNGKIAFTRKKCTSCHAKDTRDIKQQAKQARKEFFAFQKTMPRSMYGNKIDWMQAESKQLIILKDSLPGYSFPQQAQVSNMRDEPLDPSLPGLPNIIFSHSKHVTWNGCGMCHPTPFALENGKTGITMKEIIDGELCGRCHGTVAFPINDCSLCHSKPVSL